MLYVIVFLLVGLTLLIFFRDLRRNQNKLKTTLSGSRIYESRFGSIHYKIIGEGESVLISHGITGGVDQSIGLTETYFNKKYKFICVSRFGYLESESKSEFNVRNQSQAYKELLEHLGIDSVYVFGTSAGGASCMVFANEYPNLCKGLILLSSNYPGTKNPAPPKLVIQYVFGVDFIYWTFIKLIGKLMLSTFLPSNLMRELTRRKIKEIKENVFISSLPISLRRQGIFNDLTISNPFINDLYFENLKLEMPVLIIHGLDDPSIPIECARRLATKHETCLLKELKGGHLLIGCEDKVKYSIDKFIEQ